MKQKTHANQALYCAQICFSFSPSTFQPTPQFSDFINVSIRKPHVPQQYYSNNNIMFTMSMFPQYLSKFSLIFIAITHQLDP